MAHNPMTITKTTFVFRDQCHGTVGYTSVALTYHMGSSLSSSHSTSHPASCLWPGTSVPTDDTNVSFLS